MIGHGSCFEAIWGVKTSHLARNPWFTKDLWTWNGAWALVTNNGPKLWDHVGGIGNTGLYVHGGWSSGGLWKFNLEARE